MLEKYTNKKYLKIIWFIVVATNGMISIYFINNLDYSGILVPLWGISAIGTLMIFAAINSELGMTLWFIVYFILLLELYSN